MRRLRPLLLIATGIVLGLGVIVIAVYVGLFDIPDSFFYATLAQYFYTGEVFPIQPFNLTKPQTLFGPVYGLLTVPLISQPWPVGMVVVPLVQLLMLVIGAGCLYGVMRKNLPGPWPLITAALFILLPFQLIYATYLMSETLTGFLLVIWLVVLHRWLNGKRWSNPALLILIAAVATLTRYVFQMLFYISLAIWLWELLPVKAIKTRLARLVQLPTQAARGNILRHIPAVLGIGLIVGWMYFNYRINGVWVLSILQGRHIYNNVVTVGRFLPPDDHPIMQFFLERYGRYGAGSEVMYEPWWDVQLILNDGIIPEWKIDQLYRDLSLAAIKTHPIPYAIHVVRMTFRIATTAPYYPETIVGTLTSCRLDPPPPAAGSCRFEWNRYLCRPARESCAMQAGWGDFIAASIAFYPWGALVLYLLSGVGVAVSLFRKSKFLHWAAVLFAIMHVLSSSTEWVEGRFLVPLYPLYAIEIAVGVHWLLHLIRTGIRRLRTAHRE